MPSEIESEGSFSNLSPSDVPVDTDTQNFLKYIICMPIQAITQLGSVADNYIFK